MHRQILKFTAVLMSIYGLMLFSACTRVVYESPPPSEPSSNAFPDLRVAISAPASAVAGSDIGPQLAVQVRNDGNGIAFGTQSAGSNGYMVDVVLSRDTSVPEGWATYAASYHEDVLLKGGRISNTVDLSPRQGRRYKVGGGIPADTPPGWYFICARVDAGNTVSELNEGNNAACARIRITAAPVIEEPAEEPTERDCVSFNPQRARVVQIRGSWKIVDGRHWLFDFGQKQAEAQQALRIIQHYGMNQSCFVGRPQPSFQYLLVSGNAPEGSMPGEDCVAFNPQRARVVQIRGSWKIVDGSHWLFDFGANKSEAMTALEIIKRHGFTHSCFVGRPNASFTYLRKGPSQPARSPDLRVVITAPASAVAGSDIGPQLAVQVRNDGNGIAFGTQSAGSNGYMVDVVLSRDTSVPEGWATYAASYHEDVLLKGGRISNTVDLSPRQGRRYKVGGGIPADTPPGWYFICARVDAGNTVGELREDNNVACARIRITAAPTSEGPIRLPPALPPSQPMPTPGPTQAPIKEDCVSFNPQTAKVVPMRGSWKIVDGRHWLFDFGKKQAEAQQALRIIKHYGMNQSCFVGRPQPSFQYLLVSGNAPERSMPGEDCVAFNPQRARVVQIRGSWKIVDGSHWLFDFGANKSEAMTALEIIKRHGFTHSCFIGRPNASFTYLRK